MQDLKKGNKNKIKNYLKVYANHISSVLHINFFLCEISWNFLFYKALRDFSMHLYSWYSELDASESFEYHFYKLSGKIISSYHRLACVLDRSDKDFDSSVLKHH